MDSVVPESHLRQLQVALKQRGWKITERLRGDLDVPGAATWEIRRSDQLPAILIDFDGFGSLGEDIPLEESYGCKVRGTSLPLYFSRVNRSHARWTSDFAEFTRALDTLNTD